MGGNGGVIIIDDVKTTLGKPLIHGQLPAKLQGLIDPILLKDAADWTQVDKIIAGHVLNWALCNIQ